MVIPISSRFDTGGKYIFVNPGVLAMREYIFTFYAELLLLQKGRHLSYFGETSQKVGIGLGHLLVVLSLKAKP